MTPLLHLKKGKFLISSNVHLAQLENIHKHSCAQTYTLTIFRQKFTVLLMNMTFFEPYNNPVLKIQLQLLLNGLSLGKDIHHHLPDEDSEAQRVAGSLRAGFDAGQSCLMHSCPMSLLCDPEQVT